MTLSTVTTYFLHISQPNITIWAVFSQSNNLFRVCEVQLGVIGNTWEPFPGWLEEALMNMPGSQTPQLKWDAVIC